MPADATPSGTVQIRISSRGAVEVPTPIHIEAEAVALADGPLRLVPEGEGAPVLAQKVGKTIIALLLNFPAQTARNYRVEVAPHFSGVELSAGESTLALGLPEGQFGVYHFEARAPRPYVWPLIGPGGLRVTRNFPMEEVSHEEHDHPHHRSLFSAFDEVNGTNNWAETSGHGFTRHERFLDVHQGAVCGGFTAESQWQSAEGQPILREERSLRLYNCGPEIRLFDYEVSWRADFGDVTFGDTKEAGVIALRMATSMDGKHGGLIQNSEGGQGEADCWGRQAAWCDYSGHVDGAVLGVAVFDHPQNPNFPTRWHVRDYGLLATNPFSTQAFGAGEATPFQLTRGQSVTFNYRVLLHRGRAEEGRVADFYRSFAEAPEARVLRT